MLLEGSALPLLVDKAVAPPSSLGLHQGKGIWKEEGGSKFLVRLLLWHVKQPEWSRSGFRNTLVSSHTVVNLGRKLVSRQLNSPCSNLAHTGSLADPPETTFPSLNPWLQLFCPMHRKRWLSRDLPHPLLGAMSPRHAKQEEVKRPRLQTAIASRSKLLFYKASISCSSTLTALESMHGVG